MKTKKTKRLEELEEKNKQLEKNIQELEDGVYTKLAEIQITLERFKLVDQCLQRDLGMEIDTVVTTGHWTAVGSGLRLTKQL